MTEIVKVRFHGDELEAIRDGGDVYVVVKRVCEALGVAHQSQLERLKADPSIGVTMIVTPSAGGDQETACIALRDLPLWLAKMHPSKVSASVRAKLIIYQRECAEVLANHFFGPRSGTGVFTPEAVVEIATRAAVTAVATVVQPLTSSIEKLLTVVRHVLEHPRGADPAGVAGERGASFIKSMLRRYAAAVASGNPQVQRAARTRAENDLRAFLGYFGKGSSWRELPSGDFARATRFLRTLVDRAEGDATADAQASIPGMDS